MEIVKEIPQIHKLGLKMCLFKEHLRGKKHMELFCNRNTIGARLREILLITIAHVLRGNDLSLFLQDNSLSTNTTM